MSAEGINKIMNQEPLRDKGDKFNKIITGGEEEEQVPTDTEQSEPGAGEEEEQVPTDTEQSEPGEERALEELRETRLSTNEIMEHYNKIIDEFYKDNDAEKYFKRIKYLTIMLPESKFEEIAEEEAEKLSQMNFNGVKLFKDIAEARQFLHDLRYGRRNRFKGQNQKFYKLPKIQKIINQSNQTKQLISPMMARNIKPLTRTNYIYEY